jgi:predicted outer membrane repeat protein
MRKESIGNPAVYAKVRRCCVAITIAILGSGSASADNATVGNGTPGSCTESALNTALLLVVPGSDAPGGTLNFQCGPAPHTIALTSSKFLSDQVTIDGGGLITFDGQNLTRIFTLSVPNGGRTEVLLKDLTLARGFASADFGGAILANGGVQLGLQNVMVRDSRAGLSGGAIAISPGGLLTVNGSRFERNRARDGGAIAASCDVQISGSVFFNNDAEVDQGGALQIWTSTLTASDTRFEFNAALNGGAVLQRGGTATLNQAVFVDNQARDRGGAYHVYENGQATINGASFTGNTAVNDGGAVYVAGQLDAGVSNEVIGSRMQIVGSDLNGNSAQRAGGGAYVFGIDAFDDGLIGELRLVDTLVRNNQSATGGGIYNRGALHATDVLISGNQAVDGGGLYLPQTANLAQQPVPRLEMTRTTVSNNVASGAGGGMWTGPYARTFQGVVFSGNQARDGGAIALFSQSLDVFINLSLVNNTASRWGGGVYIDYSFGAVIQATTFSGNQVVGTQGRGGDLYVAATSAPTPSNVSTVFLVNSTLIGSVANQGSSIFATSKTDVRLQRSLVFPLIGGACVTSGDGIVRSDGANIVPTAGCPITALDQSVANVADIGLSALTTFPDGSRAYLPGPTSIALDQQACDATTDQRGLSRLVDIDQDGFALCDAGAIERQLSETPDLFKNGFE